MCITFSELLGLLSSLRILFSDFIVDIMSLVNSGEYLSCDEFFAEETVSSMTALINTCKYLAAWSTPSNQKSNLYARRKLHNCCSPFVFAKLMSRERKGISENVRTVNVLVLVLKQDVGLIFLIYVAEKWQHFTHFFVVVRQNCFNIFDKLWISIP